MHKALYPGTFDPITLGHMNIIEKASKLYDEVIVGVAAYTNKSNLMNLEERANLCRFSCAHLPNVRVQSFEGLVVDFARALDCPVMIRGMRAVSDFEYELSLALTNKKLNPDIETIFLVPSLKYMYLSSSMVRQIAALGGNLKDMVPECVQTALEQKAGLTNG
ncbi:MAG: pantetheine-phosphate adenylyltransferase [Candidatus Cloacimonadota bacterium]